MKTKITLFLVLAIFIMQAVSCRKHDKIDNPSVPEVPGPPKEGLLISTAVFGTVVDENDQPLTGVRVSAGGKSVLTDENGIYNIPETMLDATRGNIRAVKAGYFVGTKITPAIKDGVTRPMTIKLLPQKSLGKISATAGGTVGTTGIKMQLPAGAIEGYNGQVNAVAAYINPTRSDFAAMGPGDMTANDRNNQRVGLISYGMAHMDLLDDSGNKLKLKAGMEVTITMPVPPSLQGNAQASIPLWYFDETKGIWIEEGSAALQNGAYVGKVKHFSVWNCDRPAKLFNFLLDISWPAANTISPILGAALSSSKGIMTIVELYDDAGNLADEKVIYAKPGDAPVPVTSQAYSDHLKPVIKIPPSAPPLPGPNPMLPKPDYPITKPGRYSPVGGEIPPPSEWTPPPTLSGTGTPTSGTGTSRVPIQVTSSGAGDGVSVQGKAIDCNNVSIKDGYARIVFKNGSTIVSSTVAPIYFGQEGNFYGYTIIPNGTPNTIDNIEVIVYDTQTALKSTVQKISKANTKAIVLNTPVAVCSDPSGPPASLKQIANYTINSLAQLQSFVNEGYEAVSGTLTIQGAAITELSSITKLKQVGQLIITQTGISTLGGLANLEAIYYGINMEGNNNLVNVDFPKLANRSFVSGFAFSNHTRLTSIRIPSIRSACENGNGIKINGNPLLTSLQLPNLTNINSPTDLWIGGTGLVNLDMFANINGTMPDNKRSDAKIENNPALQSISGLKNIILGYRVNIENNPLLSNITGLNLHSNFGLSNYTDGAYLYINGNNRLTEITLPVANIYGELQIARNRSLSSMSFPKLVNLGSATISENDVLKQLGMPVLGQAQALYYNTLPQLSQLSLPALQQINPNGTGGQLWLSNISKLNNLSLPMLKKIGGRLLIERCTALANLNGLAALEKVATTAEFKYNNALVSFCGLNKLVNGNGIGGRYDALANEYNPTLQNLKDGKCSK